MSDSTSKPLRTSQPMVPPTQLALLSCWAAAVGALGGFASGLAISKFGTIGAIILWPVGEVAGLVGRRLVAQKSKTAGGILVVACVGAFVVAEVCWIHWNTIQGEASWLVAFRWLPTFMQESPRDAAIGGIFCLIGANSAFRQVSRRYKFVRIED